MGVNDWYVCGHRLRPVTVLTVHSNTAPCRSVLSSRPYHLPQLVSTIHYPTTVTTLQCTQYSTLTMSQ